MQGSPEGTGCGRKKDAERGSGAATSRVPRSWGLASPRQHMRGELAQPSAITCAPNPTPALHFRTGRWCNLAAPRSSPGPRYRDRAPLLGWSRDAGAGEPLSDHSAGQKGMRSGYAKRTLVWPWMPRPWAAQNTPSLPGAVPLPKCKGRARPASDSPKPKSRSGIVWLPALHVEKLRLREIRRLGDGYKR